MRERFGRLAVAKSASSAAFSLGEDAARGGERRDAGALVLAEAEADLVLLDHGDVGVGGGLRAADQRLDGGEARLAGLGVERLQRREPAPAGDQAVGQGAPRAGDRQRRHLDRRALAVGAQDLAQGAPSPRPRPAGGRGSGGRGRWRRAAGRAPCGRSRGRGAASRRAPRSAAAPAASAATRAIGAARRGAERRAAARRNVPRAEHPGGEAGSGGQAAAGHQAVSFSRAGGGQLVAAPGGEQQPLEGGVGLRRRSGGRGRRCRG